MCSWFMEIYKCSEHMSSSESLGYKGISSGPTQIGLSGQESTKTAAQRSDANVLRRLR
jgi:hypothetical protein